MNSSSLISIVIPTYNRSQLLINTIISVLKQSYKDWECLIVDDGSEVIHYNAIKAFIEPYTKVKLLSRPKNRAKGANACRNFGLERAIGDFLVFFDSDDFMYPNYLEFQLNSLLKFNTNYSICKCEQLTIDGKLVKGFFNDDLTSNNPINDYISFKIFWPINSVMYKTSFLRSHALQFNERLQQSQEYDFHVRVLQKDINYAIEDTVLVKVISTENSISYSKTNGFAKAYSSLRVRHSFIKNKQLQLTSLTQTFLLKDLHRIFMHQTMNRDFKASFVAGYYYLLSHLYTGNHLGYFLKHLIPVKLLMIIYNLTGKGYQLFKKSNTFNSN